MQYTFDFKEYYLSCERLERSREREIFEKELLKLKQELKHSHHVEGGYKANKTRRNGRKRN